MKKVISTLFILLFACSTTLLAQDNYAIISGTIKNLKRSWIVIEKLIQPITKKDTVKVDANGSFTFKTGELEDVQAYRLTYGDGKTQTDAISSGEKNNVVGAFQTDKIELLLDKTYHLNISFDANDKANTLKITGKGAELCAYYNEKIDNNFVFNKAYAKMQRATKDAFLTYLDGYQNTTLSLIKKHLPPLKYLPKDYIQKEEQMVKYNMARMKAYFAYSNINRFKSDSILKVFDDNYFAYLKDMPFNRKEDKENRFYTIFIRTYTDYLLARNNKGEKLTESEKFTQKYELYKTLFKSDELRDFQMYDMLYQYNSRATEGWYETAVKDYNTRAKSDSLKYEINNILVIRQKMGKGMPATDFTVLDDQGNKHSLTEFKGKYILIDAWATWCKPCVAEIPHLKKMEQDYHGKNIVFLSVSIDNDYTRWKKYVETKGLKGHQLWAGNDKSKGFCKEFIIQGIPRFILIGPDGKFIDANAPRPSYPELSMILRGIKELKTPIVTPSEGESEN